MVEGTDKTQIIIIPIVQRFLRLAAILGGPSLPPQQQKGNASVPTVSSPHPDAPTHSKGNAFSPNSSPRTTAASSSLFDEMEEISL